MKNHPVNNDYVQNLVESLVSESKQTVYQSENKPENKSYLTKDVKLDKFPIEKPVLKKKIDEDIDSRIINKLESAGGGAEFDKKKAEYVKKVADKKRERLAAEDSIQKESYDVADSRLSDEELKVDKNVKTRGVKKKRGEKPVPMTNSKGEKIGEQDSGTRPRSQDLNTQGRLNKSREGEGMLAKGKRFIKKKFS